MTIKTKNDRKNRRLMEKGGGRGDSDEDTNFDAEFIDKTRKAVETHCSGKSPEWCYGFKRGMDYGRLDAFDDSMNKPTRGKSSDYSEKSGAASNAEVADVDREALLYGMSKDALAGYKAGYTFGHSNALEDMKRGLPDTFTKEMVQEKTSKSADKKWKSCMDIDDGKGKDKKWKSCMDIDDGKGKDKKWKSCMDIDDGKGKDKKWKSCMDIDDGKVKDKKWKSCMDIDDGKVKGKGLKTKNGYRSCMDVEECKLTEGLFKKWHALLFTDDEDAEISDEFPATFMYALGAMKTISALTAEAKKEFRDLIKDAQDIEDEESFLDILKKLDEFGETYGLWTPSFVESYENSEDDEGEEPDDEASDEEGFEDEASDDGELDDRDFEETPEEPEEDTDEMDTEEDPEDDELLAARREARRRILRKRLQESWKRGRK